VTPDQEHAAEALFARAQAGDRQAYADLLTQLASAARAFVRGRAGHAPWVDDVVQETLMAVHRARRTYDPRRPLAPWFYAIARNRLIDAIRRERRIDAREIRVDEPPDDRALPSIDADATIDPGLLDALRTLPPRQREVIEALKLKDQSVRDVSARLKMSESAVKVTAHRGYAALRRLLGARDQ
jgi:RNA polymerase sigma-70 factor (ECF subfamily)